MSHCCCSRSTEAEPRSGSSRLDIGNADAHEDAAMTAGLAEALPALLLEHPKLGPARFTVDDPGDLGVGDKRRTRHDVTCVPGHEQHLVEGHLRPVLAGPAVDFDDGAWRHLELTAAGLN